MGTRELEALAIEKLGGGPYFFRETLPETTGAGFYGSRYGGWSGAFVPASFTMSRFAGPEGGPLYVVGESWDDVARKAGLA